MGDGIIDASVVSGRYVKKMLLVYGGDSLMLKEFYNYAINLEIDCGGGYAFCVVGADFDELVRSAKFHRRDYKNGPYLFGVGGPKWGWEILDYIEPMDTILYYGDGFCATNRYGSPVPSVYHCFNNIILVNPCDLEICIFTPKQHGKYCLVHQVPFHECMQISVMDYDPEETRQISVILAGAVENVPGCICGGSHVG